MTDARQQERVLRIIEHIDAHEIGAAGALVGIGLGPGGVAQHIIGCVACVRESIEHYRQIADAMEDLAKIMEDSQ